MKASYLNNITTEATDYYRKVTLMPDGRRNYNVRPARLKHLVKLVKYRDRAYSGGRDDNRFA
tara:strand:+ start:568 stop:753 length:186 start_codon:yes stop_codon:yes gene_type:complete